MLSLTNDTATLISHHQLIEWLSCTHFHIYPDLDGRPRAIIHNEDGQISVTPLRVVYEDATQGGKIVSGLEPEQWPAALENINEIRISYYTNSEYVVHQVFYKHVHYSLVVWVQMTHLCGE